MPSQKPPPSPQRKRFGKNVAQLRKTLKFTQWELAEAIDVDRRYIQGLEYGDYWPSLPVLARLKQALDCDWEDLLEGCENSKPKKA
jgi:transcriptional regulator with XRE-family HTH domain